MKQNKPLNISRISVNPVGEFLKPFLRPRTPGSTGSKTVQDFLIDQFVNKLGWHSQVDRFEASVPIPGSVLRRSQPFINLIFTKNPQAKKRLVLAAHYDSKVFVEGQQFHGQFIGATDSAWPCALLVELAHALQAAGLGKKGAKEAHLEETTLQIIFFDGEEAQVHWGPDDSIYGARNLAEKWAVNPDVVAGVDLFILFDLLGAENPSFISFFPNTHHHFQKLALIHQTLLKSSHLLALTSSNIPLFSGRPASVRIEDDHIPFVDLGIPVLHIIPIPFPRVWHTIMDDKNALHNPTIHDLTLIFYHFLSDYFHLLGTSP